MTCIEELTDRQTNKRTNKPSDEHTCQNWKFWQVTNTQTVRRTYLPKLKILASNKHTGWKHDHLVNAGDNHILLFIFSFVYFFHFDFKDVIQYATILSEFLHFYENYFSRVRHASHPGRGHGFLTCHMTQFPRSDWLRSANFTNIMIEYDIAVQDADHSMIFTLCNPDV